MKLKFTRLLARLLLIVGVLAGFSATAQAAITITDTKPTIAQGTLYSQAPYFTASGGVAPYTYAVTVTGGPAAPNWGPGGGFTFNANGTLSGLTCNKNGNVTYDVTVTDSTGATATLSSANTVNKAPAGACQAGILNLNSTTPASTPVGGSYSQTNTATGGTGPYVYSYTGTLPPGTTFDPATGTVSGTPTTAGTYTYQVTATDTLGNTGGPNTVNAVITAGTQAPLTVQISSSSTNTTPGTATLSTVGGTGDGAVTYTVTSGTCTVSGNILTSTENGTCVVQANKAASTDGSYAATTSTNTVSFTTNTNLTPTPPLSITISAPNATIPSLGDTAVDVSGVPVDATGTISFTVSGPCTVSPNPVTLPTVTTTVTSTGPGGTCTVTANYSGDNKYLPATATSTITVTPPVPSALTLGPASIPAANLGVAYSQSFTAAGGTPGYTYTISSIPPGMNFNTATGQFYGVPNAPGTYTFDVCAIDSGNPQQTTCHTYTFTVAGGIGITTTSVPAPTLGAPYAQPIVVANALGAVTYAITAGALPAGLSLNPTTGVISGNSQASGCYNFTVTATDSGRISPFNTTSKAYSFCVTRPDPSQDANVRGIISSQARAAYRFVRGQIALIQSHLDHLHDDDDSGDGCSDPDRPGAVRDLCIEYDNQVQIRGAQRTLSGQEQDVQNLRHLNDVAALADPTGVATQNRDAQRLTQNQIEKQSKVASVDPMINTNNTQDGRLGASDPNMRNFSALAVERSSNYPARTAGQAPEIVGPTPRIKGGVKVNVWTAGEVDFGRYDNQGRLLNEKFNVGSLAVGADMRVMPGLRAGVAFGYGNDYATINYGAARSEAQNFSATGYASYRIAPGIFVDGLFGYGDLHYFSNRLGGDSSWISGNRTGYALFQSLALTVEKRYGGLKIAPYVRVDGGQVYLNSYTEMGSREWALSYNGANTNTVDAVGGVRASYDYKLNNGGVITPNARAQFQKFFTSSVSQWMNYAIDPSMSYNYFDMGQLQWLFMGTIGAQYTLDNISAGVDFVTTTSGARYQTNGVRANIRVSF